MNRAQGRHFDACCGDNPAEKSYNDGYRFLFFGSTWLLREAWPALVVLVPQACTHTHSDFPKMGVLDVFCEWESTAAALIALDLSWCLCRFFIFMRCRANITHCYLHHHQSFYLLQNNNIRSIKPRILSFLKLCLTWGNKIPAAPAATTDPQPRRLTRDVM